jgi:hypothetical protein
MIDQKEVRQRIERIAELEREANALATERAQIIDRMNFLYHQTVLVYEAEPMTSIVLESHVYQDLREAGEHPALVQRLCEVDNRRSEINIAVETLRWELFSILIIAAETAMPLNGLLFPLAKQFH